MAGETATYQLTVASNSPMQQQAGLDVAASDGTLALDATSMNMQVYIADVTHTVPAGPAPTITFPFDFTAPTYGGTVTLYGAGNSTDGDGTEQGDQGATTKLVITVTGPPPDLAPPLDLATPADLAAPDLAMADLARAHDLAAPRDASRSSTSKGCACAIGGARGRSCPSALVWCAALLCLVARWTRS